ncbi:MAG: hypothetical protein E7652_05655 [Ruminococcaceae bacterium]|nr:hypothetical protein [Oscillospiraceae bacterium]
MKKVPVALVLDDPAPCISVYYTHHDKNTTEDGRPLIEYNPNSTLFEFCDIIEKYGIKGKFSVVPMPGNRGDIVRGIDGVSDDDLKQWLDTVKRRVMPAFSVGPEMLTHNMAVDVTTGKRIEINECIWAADKDRSVLTPYISKAFSILREAGFESRGCTSPWSFGIEVEDEYVQSVSRSVYDVYGDKNCWYYLRGQRDVPNAKPWVEYDDGEYCVVSIPATTFDHIWQTIDTTDTSYEFISSVADKYITSDGKDGQIVRVLETGGFPLFITHWQSLISNGLCTGMRVLELVAERINTHLSDRVEWYSYEEIMKLVLSDKKSYPKPIFKK